MDVKYKIIHNPRPDGNPPTERPQQQLKLHNFEKHLKKNLKNPKFKKAYKSERAKIRRLQKYHKSLDEIEYDYFKKHPKELKTYLKIAMEEFQKDGNVKAFLGALSVAAKVHGGFSKLANNPKFYTIIKVMKKPFTLKDAEKKFVKTKQAERSVDREYRRLIFTHDDMLRELSKKNPKFRAAYERELNKLIVAHHRKVKYDNNSCGKN